MRPVFACAVPYISSEYISYFSLKRRNARRVTPNDSFATSRVCGDGHTRQAHRVAREPSMIHARHLAIAIALVLSGSAPAQESVRAADTYNAASGMLGRGLDDLAVQEYSKFLDAYPDHELADQARYGLGVAQSRLGHHQETVEALEPLLTKDRFPYVVESALLSARAMLALDRSADAARVLTHVIRRHEDHSLAPQAVALQIEAFYRDKDFAKAVAAFEESASALTGSSAERATYFAAIAEVAQEHPRQAIGLFARLESGNSPIAASARLMLARTLQQQGDLEAARSAYQNAKSRADGPGTFEPQLGLAQVLIDLDRLDDAARELDALQSEGLPADARFRADLERGRLAVLQEDFERARRLLVRLPSQAPEPIRDDACYWLARAQVGLGSPDEASLTLIRALKDFPESPLRHEMMYQLGLALDASGKPQEAIQTLRQLGREAEGEPLAGEALLAAASIAQQAGDLSLAQQLSQEASGDLTGEAATDAAFLAAEAAYQRQDFADAARAFESLLAAIPKDHERAFTARYRLGLSQKQLGDTEAARRTLASLFSSSQTDERFLPGLLALGDMAFAAESWEEAAQWLDRYTKLGSDHQSWDAAMLRLGLAWSNAGDRRKALASFESLVTQQPRSPLAPRAQYEAGLVALALQETPRAQEAFESASRSPDAEIRRLAFQQLGVLASTRGRNDEAASYFDQAASLAPSGTDARSRLNQARALLASGAFAKAADVLSRLNAQDLDRQLTAERSALLTLALAKQDQFAKAADASRVLVDQPELLSVLGDDTASSVLYERARALRALDLDDEASRTLELLLERTPDSPLTPNARLELASLAMDALRYDEAGSLCAAILRDTEGVSDSITEQATYRMGVCARELGDHQAGSKLLSELARRTPPDALSASAALLAGESFAEIGNLGKAAEMLEIAADTGDDATATVALLRLGEAQIGLQSWPKAQATYERFLTAYSSDPRAYLAIFGKAWALENQGRHDAAIDGYRAVIASHDGETAARAQFQIGECLYAQKKYEDAVRELLRVDLVYAYPQWSAGALFEAGRCFEELDREADARAQYEQVVNRFADSQWAELASRRLSRFQLSTQQGG